MVRSAALFAVLLGALSCFAQAPPALPNATVIPLAQTMSVADALVAVQRAFPNVIEDRADLRNSAAIFSGGPRTFWATLDALAALTNTSLRVLPTERKVQFAPGVLSLPTHIDGPYRLLLRRLATALDLETNTTSCTATLEVAWEPGLFPFYLDTYPHDLTVVDPQGKAHAQPNAGSSLVPVDGRIALTFDIRLPALPRTDRTIRTLTGQLAAIVPTRLVSVTMPAFPVLEAAEAKSPTLAFPAGAPQGRISRITRTRDRWTVQVALPTPPGDAVFESYQSWVVQNEMTLRTQDGKVWKSTSYLLEGNTPSRSVVSYHFAVRDCPTQADPALWSVQYTTPAGLVRMTVPFRFADLPLP